MGASRWKHVSIKLPGPTCKTAILGVPDWLSLMFGFHSWDMERKGGVSDCHAIEGGCDGVDWGSMG